MDDKNRRSPDQRKTIKETSSKDTSLPKETGSKDTSQPKGTGSKDTSHPKETGSKDTSQPKGTSIKDSSKPKDNPEVLVGQTLIEKAKTAQSEQKKKEAFDLYKQGIQHLLRGIKDHSLNEEVKKKLKHQCSECLQEAEILQNEIQDKGPDKKRQSPVPEESPIEAIEKILNGIIDTERPNVTLDDVCGCEDAKEALKESIVLPIKFPQLFHGKTKPWKGILLYGAPGTGKTMLGRALAAEIPDVCYMRVCTSDLISKWFGESERIVRRLFEKAKKQKQHCVLFIDDLEQLFSDPEMEHDWLNKIRTELLYQVDNIDGVFLLTGTNEPWKIPQNFLRRLNKRVLVPMPDHAARKQIFMNNIKSLKHDVQEEDYKMFADKTEGYTGSDICVVVRDAAMEPVRKLQSATHYKKVKGPSLTDPNVVVDDLLTPCSPDDADAIKMTWMNIPENKLSEPVVCTADILKSLEKSSPSVDEDYLQKLKEFTEQCKHFSEY